MSFNLSTFTSNPTYLATATIITVASILAFIAYRKFKTIGPNGLNVIVLGRPKFTRKLIVPYQTSDGKRIIVMEKATKDRGGWSFRVPDNAICTDEKGRNCVYVHAGAPEGVTFNFDRKGVEEPHWNKDEATKLNELKALTIRYKEGLKDITHLQTMMWIIMIVLIVSIAIGAFNAYMINKIPVTPTTTPTNPSVPTLPSVIKWMI